MFELYYSECQEEALLAFLYDISEIDFKAICYLGEIPISKIPAMIDASQWICNLQDAEFPKVLF